MIVRLHERLDGADLRLLAIERSPEALARAVALGGAVIDVDVGDERGKRRKVAEDLLKLSRQTIDADKDPAGFGAATRARGRVVQVHPEVTRG